MKISVIESLSKRLKRVAIISHLIKHVSNHYCHCCPTVDLQVVVVVPVAVGKLAVDLVAAGRLAVDLVAVGRLGVAVGRLAAVLADDTETDKLAEEAQAAEEHLDKNNNLVRLCLGCA